MAKGYWIAHMTVNDADTYGKYVAVVGDLLKKYGGRFIIRAGRYEAAEGQGRPRNIVVEFPSYDDAVACYHSPEYQAAAAIRKGAAEGELTIVEGHDG